VNDRFDPITLEIIQSSLQSISEEMFGAMRKTAMSPIIYEVLDMATAITDAEGNLASSGAGIPGFVGVLDKAVKRILQVNGEPGEIGPGDVFATNDPFYGGVTHLSDVVLAMPVFAGDELVAWTANMAHWNDVGGMVPGSISNEATQIFQEGLRLPAVKLIAGGTPIKSVLEIMKCNSRLPDFLQGDMWAGIAAVRIGEKRILELIEKYGCDTFEAAMALYLDYGEQVSRRALADLPKGALQLGGGAGQRRRLSSDGRDHRRRVHRRPPREPGPGRRSEQRLPGRLDDLRADDLQEHHRCARRRERRHLPPADASDSVGLRLRCTAARGVRRLLRGDDSSLRPALALPRAPSRRSPAGG
jgi:N-methylhydantoinase B/oxoprolinase/acetone carboxylase alpha subunit